MKPATKHKAQILRSQIRVRKGRPAHALQVIRKNTGIQYHISRAVVRSLFLFIQAELQKGNEVCFAHFGTFKLIRRKGRTIKSQMSKMQGGKWVRTGATMIQEHPSAEYVRFHPSPTLKQKIWEVRKPIYKNKS